MNEETIKELLSVNFIRVIAEREGFIVTKVEQDDGDDLMIKKVKKLKSSKGFKYFTTGEMFEIQLKCTTEKSIQTTKDGLKFRLKGRNYYHLVERFQKWKSEKYTPLLLIILVLPNDETNWLTLNTKIGGLTIGGKAFWYLPSETDTASLDITQKTISISSKNQVSLDTFKQLFKTGFLKIVK